MSNVEFKLLHNNAQLPEPSQSGWDIYAHQHMIIPPNKLASIRTGIAIGIPEGFVGQMFERNSWVQQHPMQIICPLIHHGFFGEIQIMLLNLSNKPLEIRMYDKLAQLVVVPCLQTGTSVIHLSSTKTNVIGLTGKSKPK